MFNSPFYVGLFFFLIGFFLLCKKIEARRLIIDSVRWEHTQGNMLVSEAVKYSETATRWNFDAEYEYQVAGNHYNNNIVTFYTISNKEEAQRLASSFPLGKSVRVYYNPAKPQQSVLQLGNGDRTTNGEVVFSSIVVALSLGLMIIGYFGFFFE